MLKNLADRFAQQRRMQMIQAVSFDVMDVLVPRGDRAEELRDWAKKLNKQFNLSGDRLIFEPELLLPEINRLEALVGPTERDKIRHVQAVLRLFGIEASEKEALLAFSSWRQSAYRYSRISENTRTVINRVRQAKLKAAVLSTSSHLGKEICRLNGITPAQFDEVLFSVDIGHTKEEDVAFKILLKRLHLGPGEVMHIDDNHEYALRAARLGLTGVVLLSASGHARQAIKDGEIMVRGLEDEGLIVIRRLHELENLLGI